MKTGFQIHFSDKLRPQNEDVVVVVRIVRLGGQVNNLFLIPPDVYTLFKYGAQNEAYKGERGRKTLKAVYLQRVAMVEAVRSAQNETFT